MQLGRDEAEAGDRVRGGGGGGAAARFGGAGEERLQPDADAEEGLVGRDVGVDGGEVARARERAEAVPEVTDAGEDEFLEGGKGGVLVSE